MSIVCKECKREIPGSATSCPACGVSLNRTSVVVWIAAALAVAVAAALAAMVVQSPAAAPKIVQSANQIREAQQIADALSAARTIINSARNPDSVQFANVSVISKTNDICLVYRAQNGFGGMDVERGVAPGNGHTLFIEHGEGFEVAWHSRCEGKRGRDLTVELRQSLKDSPSH